MSAAALKWARSQRISDGAMKPVLIELAILHMDGKALFPSQGHLAEATGNSERTIRDALRLLEHFQVISRKKRSNGAGGRTSDGFTLAVGTPFTLPRPVISAARKALSNRRQSPVATTSKSQPAKSAGAPGEICRGIGDLGEEPSQGVTGLGIGHYAREATGDRPGLRLVSGGKP